MYMILSKLHIRKRSLLFHICIHSQFDMRIKYIKCYFKYQVFKIEIECPNLRCAEERLALLT